jgi:hypothetical protein
MSELGMRFRELETQTLEISETIRTLRRQVQALETKEYAQSSSVYTDEDAEDAVGAMLLDSSTIDFTYNGAVPSLTAIVIDDSITYSKIQNVSATDRLLGRVSALAGNIEEIEISDFVQTILNDADASAVRTTLGLGTMAVETATNYLRRSGVDALTGDWSAGAFDIILDNTHFFRVKESGGTARGIAGMNAANLVQLGAQAGSLTTAIYGGAATAALSIAGLVVTIADTGRLDTDAIRARDSGGLVLADDAGNLGIFIEDGGSVGVNNATPAAALDIIQTAVTENALRVSRNLTSTSTAAPVVVLIQDHATDDQHLLSLKQDGSGRAITLDNGGVDVFVVQADGDVQVGFGTIARTSPAQAHFQIETADTGNCMGFWRNTDDADGIIFSLGKTRSIAAGGNGLVANGDEICRILFWGGDGGGTGATQAAHIKVLVDGDPGAGDMPARMELATTRDGASSPTLAMKINALQEIFIRAGASSDVEAKVGGILFASTTAVGNVGSGEDNLITYTVPANTLATNGDSLWFEASGTVAANVNVKTLRVRFGTSGTSLILDGDISHGAVAGSWNLSGRIIRTGAATQMGYGSINSFNDFDDTVTGLDQTLSGTVSLRITGEATSNDDIVCQSLVIGWEPNNT